MLPVCIVCHAECNPPSYLCEFFDKNNIPYKKFNVLKEDIQFLDLASLSGLVFMGGPYSVNDDHEWLKHEIELIHQAIEKRVPMMGVCFGAQIISKALGTEVWRADFMETGWHQIETSVDRLVGLPPLKLEPSIEVFEWHEDVFSTPEGATPIFCGENHENQGYVLDNILVMQFHLEMTEYMVCEWLERYESCIPEPSQSVQSPEEICKNLPQRLTNLHHQADIIYYWWLKISQIVD